MLLYNLIHSSFTALFTVSSDTQNGLQAVSSLQEAERESVYVFVFASCVHVLVRIFSLPFAVARVRDWPEPDSFRPALQPPSVQSDFMVGHALLQCPSSCTLYILYSLGASGHLWHKHNSSIFLQQLFSVLFDQQGLSRKMQVCWVV